MSCTRATAEAGQRRRPPVVRRGFSSPCSSKSYGHLNVEEGADVYGIHTASTQGSSDIHLFSVGRDGATVTIVRRARLGTSKDAEVAGFKTTTVTAVNKLYRPFRAPRT
ncbi:hypothetical protein QFZ63_000507 [Streptomyces sp. B3I7]|uniref:hypothetical protein n=1 Tax=Streptomyces sp. B3I7 TaxID=3042269 RepID=UPI002789D360|nr:hypothetical protein [Streptomyces sp. B3I7]MDQ0808793.1 hypothetical protein [Streptomyces sp. B3I7]